MICPLFTMGAQRLTDRFDQKDEYECFGDAGGDCRRSVTEAGNENQVEDNVSQHSEAVDFN